MSEIEKIETRSLINLCLDLVELDETAPENKDIIQKRLNELGTKVDSYYHLDQFAQSQIDMLKKQIDWLQSQVKKYQNLQDSLYDRALYALTTMGKREIVSPSGHKMTIRQSESVQVNDLLSLPDWAITIKTDRVANKSALKEAMKVGQKIDGANLVKKDYVVIK